MTAVSSDPIRRRRLSDEVVERLREMIRTGGFRPGDQLPSERDLMRAWTVGRPVVREAMQTLERAGLIEIRHGERARIAAPSFDNVVRQLGDSVSHALTHSPSTLVELKEARALFEVEMARMAAIRGTALDVAELRAILHNQSQAATQPEAFTQLDGAFHRGIAAMSGNRIFSATAEAMFSWLAEYHTHLVQKRGREALTLLEHEAILAAIERRDADGAAAAMARHLSRAQEGLVPAKSEISA